MSAQPEDDPGAIAAEAPGAGDMAADAPAVLEAGEAAAEVSDAPDAEAIDAHAPGALDAGDLAAAAGAADAPDSAWGEQIPAGLDPAEPHPVPAEPPIAPPLAANDPAPLALQEQSAPPAVEAPEPPDPADWDQALRLAEALIFAADRPITPQRLQPVLPERCDARAVLAALAARRAADPVRLVEVAGGWAFRTAPELAPQLTRVVEVPRRLPRAAMETLVIIAYHQPVTRAEVEEIRGAALAQTTLESLLEMGLVQPRGRKEVPGRPSLWGTTTKFLEQFGLRSLNELPRREELVNEPTLPFAAPPAAA